MEYTTLIVPGLNNSGSNHWQTLLEEKLSNARRVNQTDWDSPKIIPWARNVQNGILEAESPVILIAHSFGVLACVIGASRITDKVAGAFYVAPADPVKFTSAGQILSEAAQNWDTGLYNLVPKDRLGYPAIVAASQDDPYMAFKRAAWWATKWQSRFISLGFAGHVNPNSGYGDWPEGEKLHQELIETANQDRLPQSNSFNWG